MAQSMKRLLCKHGDLPDFVPLYPHKKVGMIVCFCNPSTREMEAGGSPGLLAACLVEPMSSRS